MPHNKEGFFSGFWLGFTFLFKSWFKTKPLKALSIILLMSIFGFGFAAGLQASLLVLVGFAGAVTSLFAISVVTGLISGIIMKLQGDEANKNFRAKLQQVGAGTSALVAIFVGIPSALFLYSGLAQILAPGSELFATFKFINPGNALVFTAVSASILAIAAIAIVVIPAVFYSPSPSYKKTDLTTEEQEHLMQQEQTLASAHTASVRGTETILPDFENTDEKKND